MSNFGEDWFRNHARYHPNQFSSFMTMGEMGDIYISKIR